MSGLTLKAFISQDRSFYRHKHYQNHCKDWQAELSSKCISSLRFTETADAWCDSWSWQLISS